MTTQARTKLCSFCEAVITEGLRVSSKEWDRKKFCDSQCKAGSQTAEIPIEEIKRLYIEEERTTQEIGSIYGYPHATISRMLRRNEIETRKPGKRILKVSKDDSQDILTHYAKHKSTIKLHKMYPYSRLSITRFLKSKGVFREQLKERRIVQNSHNDVIISGLHEVIEEAQTNTNTSAILAWGRV